MKLFLFLFLFQMKPTRCTLLLRIFTSTSLHVSGNYVPIIRRTSCISATLVFFTFMGGCLVSRQDCHPHLLTPWCRVLLAKLTGLQLVKKFPAFHGTRSFITAIKACATCLYPGSAQSSPYTHIPPPGDPS